MPTSRKCQEEAVEEALSQEHAEQLQGAADSGTWKNVLLIYFTVLLNL